MHLYIVEEFAKELIEIETEYELLDKLQIASEHLGFDHFALSLEPRASGTDYPAVLLHNYPDEWAKVYVSFDLAGRDPVRRACDRAFTGFAWEKLDSIIPMTRGDWQMLAVGKECGIGNGFTVPRHLPGMARGTCTFVVRPNKQLPDHGVISAEFIGATALSCALKISGMLQQASPAKLSDRQRECLLWTARGKTASETAIILGISTETVIQHLKMARERYEVHCSQSLVLSAMFDGVIGFGDVFRWRKYH